MSSKNQNFASERISTSESHLIEFIRDDEKRTDIMDALQSYLFDLATDQYATDKQRKAAENIKLVYESLKS